MNYNQQEHLSIEYIPSAWDIDHKNIYNGQKIDFLLFDFDMGNLDLNLQRPWPFKQVLEEYKHKK